MCGFVAALLSSAGVERVKLDAALERIAHRGPDATCTWESPDGRMALGHVRLSIIGLVDGDQPIANEDELVRVVVNGELYGYRAIREQLRSRGHHFRTGSDSEIAVHLYEDHGADFVHQLRGEFALVVADERNRRLLAVRDRFGIKPLFYTVRDGRVFFASEVKALLELGVPARWDREAMYLDGFAFRPHQRTLFEGVYSVPPGHYAIAHNDHVTLHRYWDVEYPSRDELASDAGSDDEFVAGFREKLHDAVRERLVADVEVASYLSGGIDSCAVLGLAQRQMSRPIQAFTIAFGDELYDESLLAREMASFIGADFRPVPVSQQDVADAYGDAVWHAENVFFNAHGVAKFLLSRAVRDAGIKVVFTGEGADEILGGYAPFRRDMLLYNSEGQDPVETQRLLIAMEASNRAFPALIVQEGQAIPELEGLTRRLGWVPSWIATTAAGATRMRALLRDEFAAEMSRLDPFDAALNDLPIQRRLAGRDPVNQALYLWSRIHLPNYVLTLLSDRMEMSHSIEGRVPFLDHLLAEYVAHVPVHLKIRGMREKHILREAVKHCVIPAVYDREKHPFATPPARSDDDAMHRFACDVLASRALDDQPFFEPARVRGLLGTLSQLPDAERIGADTFVQRVLSTCLLHERFGMAA
jgi:asparagine synthase (glutamine-hydrolysing)